MSVIGCERLALHMAINYEFAVKQGLTEEEIAALPSRYLLLDDVLSNPEKYDDPVATVEKMEFDLQEAWHFPRDKRFHKYQLWIKGCTCPRLDNAELFGHTEDRYAVSDCPWHWRQ